jgi:hypothetical protein
MFLGGRGTIAWVGMGTAGGLLRLASDDDTGGLVGGVPRPEDGAYGFQGPAEEGVVEEDE